MLNATLLVQVVNFGIAYVILDRILLRYGARLILAEQKQLAQVQQEIQQATEKVTAKNARNEREWQMAQKELYDKKPVVEPVSKLQIAVPERACIIDLTSQAEVNKLVVETQQAIVERVTHD